MLHIHAWQDKDASGKLCRREVAEPYGSDRLCPVLSYTNPEQARTIGMDRPCRYLMSYSTF